MSNNKTYQVQIRINKTWAIEYRGPSRDEAEGVRDTIRSAFPGADVVVLSIIRGKAEQV